MKTNFYRVLFVLLATFMLGRATSSLGADREMSVTMKQDENGVIFVDAWPSDAQSRMSNDYIETKSKTLGDFEDWSLEDKAAYSAWLKERNIPQPYCVYGLPEEDNLEVETAIDLARKAVVSKYALKEETFAQFKVQVTFNVLDPDNPLWTIAFRVDEGNDVNDLGYYRADIDDHTGEIVHLYSIVDAKG